MEIYLWLEVPMCGNGSSLALTQRIARVTGKKLGNLSACEGVFAGDSEMTPVSAAPIQRDRRAFSAV
jgi:hypothetical protein